MPTAADFAVISDNKVSLQIGADIDHSFSIELESANVAKKAILSFMAFTEGTTVQFTLTIINGSNVSTQINVYTTTSAVERAFQEVIAANVLTASGNRLAVKIVSPLPPAKLTISDIVLWYRKSV